MKVEEGREGHNGQLSVGPVYRNPLAENEFPPLDSHLATAWDIFRYYHYEEKKKMLDYYK